VKCGVAGGPCCANNTCEGNGCCIYTYQSPAYQSLCTAAAAVCGTSPAGTCSASTPASCGTCGALSQPCCYTTNGYYVCSAPNTYCSSQSSTGVCQACGGMGQPCCGASSNLVTNSSTGTCTAGLTCRYVTTSYTCQP
jgi:hypothetical protein